MTSLAVLLAAGGSWLGFPIVDPVVGLLIGVTILFITKDAVVTMWYRLMDAIEPEILTQAETVVQKQTSIKELRRLRMRWMGHRLHAEVHIAVAPQLTTAQNHKITEHLRHELFRQIPNLTEIIVHVDPWSKQLETAHRLTARHWNRNTDRKNQGLS